MTHMVLIDQIGGGSGGTGGAAINVGGAGGNGEGPQVTVNAPNQSHSVIHHVYAPDGNPGQILLPPNVIMDERFTDCQIYCNQLLRRGRGFPLYSPEPPEIRPDGIQIGDIGTVTPQGSFDFLFNIYLPALDPINTNAPESFEPFKPGHDLRREKSYPLGNHVSTFSVREFFENLQPNQFPGGDFTFNCKASQGAVVALPHGSHMTTLRTVEPVREYARMHAISWYADLKAKGITIANGSLYLVTSCERAQSWGIAAYCNIREKEEFQARFRCTPGTSPYHQYQWIGVGEFPGQHKHHNLEPSPTNDGSNQTIFIRGLCISLGKTTWQSLIKTAVEVTDFGESRSDSVPSNSSSPSQNSSLFSRLFRAYSKKTSSDGMWHVQKFENVVVSEFPHIQDVFHPGKLLNDYLFEKVPEAEVIITHDDDWIDILTEDSSMGSKIETLSDLHECIDKEFSIEEKSDEVAPQMAFLVRRLPPQQNDDQSSSDEEKRDARNMLHSAGEKSLLDSVQQLIEQVTPANHGIRHKRTVQHLALTDKPTMLNNLKITHLHDICITSSTNPHNDLTDDMKMFAQLIIDENIFLQTLPEASENSQMSWKFSVGCNIPPHALTFSVAILRQSETEGTRLLGYIEIGRGEVVGSVESNRSTIQLELNKVNPDGPSLKLSAGFSVSQLLCQQVSGLDLIGMAEDFTSLRCHGLESELQKLYQESRKGQIPMEPLQLLLVHERLLLCFEGGVNRAQWLNILGHVIFQSYKASGTINHLNQAICAYHDAVRDHGESATYLANLGTSLLLRFQQVGNLSDINRSIIMLEAAFQLTPDSHPEKPDDHPVNLSNSLLAPSGRAGNLNDLNRPIAALEDAIQLGPNGHSDKLGILSKLVNSLSTRFEWVGDLSDLNRSIVILEDTVRLSPDGHPSKPRMLSNLGSLLSRRFEQVGNLSDLNKSIVMLEDAVRLSPDGHPDKLGILSNLGIFLSDRFEQAGNLSDLNKSIMIFENAVQLTPDSDSNKPERLSSLGSLLSCRFEQVGNLSDLNKSILMLEDAVRLSPDGHPDKPERLSDLVDSLHSRFIQGHDFSDFNRFIVMLEDAVQHTPDGHPDKPRILSNLGGLLAHHFEQVGNLSDLNRSIVMLEDAVQLTPDGHSDKPQWLSNLGNLLSCRFKQGHDLSDLNKSIVMFEDAVRLTPDGQSEKPKRLNKLGDLLSDRFQQLDDFSDLNKSIMMLEDTIRLTPDGHADKPRMLSDLGALLFRCFRQVGDLSSLHRSILMLENAVKLTPDGHSSKPSRLTNLGGPLLARFQQRHNLSDLSDLNRSIEVLENAVRLSSDDHPVSVTTLTNLANALSDRFKFKQVDDLSDLNQSIMMFELAAQLAPEPDTLNNLGNSLLDRFEWLKDLSDIDRSIMVLEDAVQLTPDGHPAKPTILHNLGKSFSCRFKQLHDPQDSEKALLHYTSAAGSKTGDIPDQVDRATKWAEDAQPSSVLPARLEEHLQMGKRRMHALAGRSKIIMW
ncbi:Pleiotropic drug resistance ABC transporter protein [Mycena sanguinolenta]|uniref:Pleiotropic drug resistance ABC transporter protein n=1 Tax=Mycena sanguinolenta TaxID=230812 RepID=A0A8H6YWN5_9AGAR|nr:Pleiotropic drug resistance ABC transporter protein [Mycena sanguinolenta]